MSRKRNFVTITKVIGPSLALAWRLKAAPSKETTGRRFTEEQIIGISICGLQ
jgi:hypothetical protein